MMQGVMSMPQEGTFLNKRLKRDIHGGEQMRKALSHAKGIREEMLLLGLKPKNHILDQKRHIKLLEIKNRQDQEERERVNPADVFKMKRFANVKSQIGQVSYF